MESEPKWTNKTKQTPAFRAIGTDGSGKETTITEALRTQRSCWSSHTLSLLLLSITLQGRANYFHVTLWGSEAQAGLDWCQDLNKDWLFYAFIPTSLSPTFQSSSSLMPWNRWGFLWKLNPWQLQKKSWKEKLDDFTLSLDWLDFIVKEMCECVNVCI